MIGTVHKVSAGYRDTTRDSAEPVSGKATISGNEAGRRVCRERLEVAGTHPRMQPGYGDMQGES